MTFSSEHEVFAGLLELGAAPGSVDAEWERLAERDGASPFLYPALVRAWADAFGGGRLSLASVRRDGELIAALPLLVDGRRIMSVGNWHTVETGGVAADAVTARLLAAVLAEQRPHTVRMELLDSAEARLLRDTLRNAGYRAALEPMLESPYLDVDGDFDALLASWPSKRRHEQRRLRRRLGELGELTYDVVHGGEEADACFEQLLALEAQDWKAASGTAIAQQPSTLRFYRAVAEWAAQRGWLRLDALRLDGRPVAISMGLEAHGVYYGLKLGADYALRKHGPGVLLLEDIVRTGFERGLRRIELLGDNDKYKRQWATTTHQRVRLLAFAPSLAGSADLAMRRYGRPLARRVRGAAADAASHARSRVAPR